MLDCIILGAGASGIEAAINLKIKNKDFLIIAKEFSVKIKKAPNIQNYLGLSNITGERLLENISHQLKEMNISITNDTIREIYPMGKYFILVGDKQYEAKTVIIATGLVNVENIVGEDEYLGQGVSYCASCDGALYRNKKILLYGKKDELDYLKSLSNDVTYIDKIDEIKYKKILSNNKEIPYDGLFIIREQYKVSTMIKGIEMENNSIKINNSMETNIKGLYACGDVAGKPYQYMKAAGQGAIAAYSAINYLEKKMSEI